MFHARNHTVTKPKADACVNNKSCADNKKKKHKYVQLP
jgi:hypothetical protein